jgi:Mlc titration factor MtfA (ptsG expression regulator)
MIFAPFVLILLFLIGYFLYKKYSVVLRRKGYQKKCLKLYPEWEKILSQNFAPFLELTGENQNLIMSKMSILYCEKSWASEISNQEKVLICARGAFPVLHRKTNYYSAIEAVSSDENGFLWYRELKKQFEVEAGTIVDRNFRDNFEQICHNYLYEDVKIELSNLHKRQLEYFFQQKD